MIHVTGSVGLFSCSIENKTASDQVLQAVGEALQKFPFSYQGARILSGQEEGAFGWVTVNYLDDRLTQVSRCCSRRTGSRSLYGSTGFVLFMHSGGLRFTVLRFCTATELVTIKKNNKQDEMLLKTSISFDNVRTASILFFDSSNCAVIVIVLCAFFMCEAE